jgi:hypothetical protein
MPDSLKQWIRGKRQVLPLCMKPQNYRISGILFLQKVWDQRITNLISDDWIQSRELVPSGYLTIISVSHFQIKPNEQIIPTFAA